MVTLPLVEFDKREGHFLFVQDGRYTSGAGGRWKAVECQDHGCIVRECVEAGVFSSSSALRWALFISFKSGTRAFAIGSKDPDFPNAHLS